jgi:hypothetical protein
MFLKVQDYIPELKKLSYVLLKIKEYIGEQ